METEQNTIRPSLSVVPLKEGRAEYRLAKRVFDIVFATLGLMVIFPVGLLIALLIKLEDGGKIFYTQKRVGRFGKPFSIWKFRSMIADADKQGALVTKQGDPRTTRIGRVSRKFKLDELPQLLNVLAGEMSFVGPRPEVQKYVDLYTPEQRAILQLTPGITDMATLLFRDEESLLAGCQDVEGFYIRHCVPKKIELNLQYASHAGLFQDIWIMVQTLCPYWLGVLMIYSTALMAGLWLCYELRADFQASAQDYRAFKRCLPWMVLPQLVLLLWQGQVTGLLSYFSIPEIRRTAAALGLACALQIGLCFLALGKQGPGPSLFIMDFVLSFFVLCAFRLGIRHLREKSSESAPVSPAQTWRVAIVGTSEFATHLALDLSRAGQTGRRLVAFFDDNPRTWHTRPHNIPVVGMPECLLSHYWQSQIDEVIVTLPEEEAARVKEIREMLNSLPLKVTFACGWPEISPKA